MSHRQAWSSVSVITVEDSHVSSDYKQTISSHMCNRIGSQSCTSSIEACNGKMGNALFVPQTSEWRSAERHRASPQMPSNDVVCQKLLRSAVGLATGDNTKIALFRQVKVPGSKPALETAEINKFFI